MNVFVVDSHAIYRRGLVASLENLDNVENVHEAADVGAARDHAALADADLVILDTSIPGGREFLVKLAGDDGARVIACTSDCDEESVNRAVVAGAAGYLHKDTLTQELLQASIHAALGGAAVIAMDMLAAALVGGCARPDPVAEPLAGQRLTDREQRVLALIAEGHPTRQVAEHLSYSERTVKNVLHDVVTKLNARSRSHAVAHAVRDGLI